MDILQWFHQYGYMVFFLLLFLGILGLWIPVSNEIVAISAGLSTFLKEDPHLKERSE